jgi:hypothetical protein
VLKQHKEKGHGEGSSAQSFGLPLA